MILAILLGPHAAFITMASVLTVQALFFADGGLLALGCNIFNLGFFPCFIAYPYVFKSIVGTAPGSRRILTGSMIAAVLALQMGALGVVLETLFSGISELPFSTFLFMMQPIHLAIGIVEGMATAAVVTFVWKARPEIMELAAASRLMGPVSIKPLLVGLLAVTLLTGGVLSWFASADPDGLEWSMARTAGKEELEAPEHGLHTLLAAAQKATAFLPEYNFKAEKQENAAPVEPAAPVHAEESWPAVNGGTSASGVIGAFMTLALAGLIGFGLRRYHQRL